MWYSPNVCPYHTAQVAILDPFLILHNSLIATLAHRAYCELWSKRNPNRTLLITIIDSVLNILAHSCAPKSMPEVNLLSPQIEIY